MAIQISAELVRRLLMIMELQKLFTGSEWSADERARQVLEAAFSTVTKWKLHERLEPDNASADAPNAIARIKAAVLLSRGLEDSSSEEIGALLASLVGGPRAVTTAMVMDKVKENFEAARKQAKRARKK